MNCIFCKIVNGEIQSEKVYEDDSVVVFKDISPTAPVHLVCIPKEHISSAKYITPENSQVVAHIFEIAAQLADEFKLQNGFRIVTNIGEDGGQSVHHLHFHLVGGKKLSTSFA